MQQLQPSSIQLEPDLHQLNGTLPGFQRNAFTNNKNEFRQLTQLLLTVFVLKFTREDVVFRYVCLYMVFRYVCMFACMYVSKCLIIFRPELEVEL